MEWWITIKKFFSDLPYDDLGDIGTFILSVVSVFTAIVTLYMLVKQHRLQKDSGCRKHPEKDAMSGWWGHNGRKGNR